jgi:phosphoribosyl 1,2-cyclic phosphate phosphodiesterase
VRRKDSNEIVFQHDGKSAFAKQVEGMIFENHDEFVISDLVIKNFEQQHGSTKSMGFLIGKIAYSTDFKLISDLGIRMLKEVELDLWIVSLTHFEGNNAHMSFEELKSVVEIVSPKRVVLTHMSHKIDYFIKENLPENWECGFDGMSFEFDLDYKV